MASYYYVRRSGSESSRRETRGLTRGVVLQGTSGYFGGGKTKIKVRESVHRVIDDDPGPNVDFGGATAPLKANAPFFHIRK